MFDLGIGWIWKSALDFVFDMDLEKCAGFCGFGKVG